MDNEVKEPKKGAILFGMWNGNSQGRPFFAFINNSMNGWKTDFIWLATPTLEYWGNKKIFGQFLGFVKCKYTLKTTAEPGGEKQTFVFEVWRDSKNGRNAKNKCCAWTLAALVECLWLLVFRYGWIWTRNIRSQKYDTYIVAEVMLMQMITPIAYIRTWSRITGNRFENHRN